MIRMRMIQHDVQPSEELRQALINDHDDNYADDNDDDDTARCTAV